MAPENLSKIGPAVAVSFVGSRFGSSHGFTHTGAIGRTGFALTPIPEGLYASAVAEAVTVTWVRPHIRAKKVGRSFLVIWTFTRGLFPGEAGKLTTTSVAGSKFLPPNLFCAAT